MSSFITKRRVASLASASAMIATMAVATMPTAALAATGSDVVVRGTALKALIVNPITPVTGTVDATGYDIAVYFGPGHSGTVDADISGATWYGVVADRANVTVTGSQIHDIGERPLDGAQHGNPIFFYDGAKGTISDNRVYNFQKNGITVSGKAADGTALSEVVTSATVANNVVIGEGPIDYIAQNGIQVSYGADATVKNNTVRDLYYTGDDEAVGLLNWEAGKVIGSGNVFVGTEMDVYGEVTPEVTTTVANVRGTSSIVTGLRSVRVDLRSAAQPANTVLGTKLDWRIKVDGRTTLHVKEGFGAHDVYRQQFRAGSGRHVIKVFKNTVLVRTAIVRA